MSTQPTSNLEELFTARPIIKVDGEIHSRVQEQLLSVEIFEEEGGLGRCELRLSNVITNSRGEAESAFEDEEILKFGSELIVYMGDEDRPMELFRGLISGFGSTFSTHKAPEVCVYAEDALQRARMRRRTRVHRNLSLNTLVDDVARSLGLQVSLTGFSENMGDHVQLGESDLAFLRRLLRRYDGDLQVVGNALHVTPRTESVRDTMDLSLYSQLRDVEVTADLAHQVTEVTVSGFDPEKGSPFQALSRGSHLQPGSGRLGGRVLEDALGARAEHLDGAPVTNEAEARILADTLFDQRARRFVRVTATSVGIPELRLGVQVRLSGLSPRFDNVYHVVRSCHRFDLSVGYETDFEAESAYLERT